jgi:hypothetical protein
MLKTTLTILIFLFLLSPIYITSIPINSINTSNKPVTQEDISRNIQIVNSNTNLKLGETGFYMIQALPNTRYTITTNYKKGTHVMSVSQWRKTDESGYATFNWVVGANTQPGVYTAIIRGGGARLKTNYIILP